MNTRRGGGFGGSWGLRTTRKLYRSDQNPRPGEGGGGGGRGSCMSNRTVTTPPPPLGRRKLYALTLRTPVKPHDNPVAKFGVGEPAHLEVITQ